MRYSMAVGLLVALIIVQAASADLPETFRRTHCGRPTNELTVCLLKSNVGRSAVEFKSSQIADTRMLIVEAQPKPATSDSPARIDFPADVLEPMSLPNRFRRVVYFLSVDANQFVPAVSVNAFLKVGDSASGTTFTLNEVAP
jgi:hypothetical protein